MCVTSLKGIHMAIVYHTHSLTRLRTVSHTGGRVQAAGAACRAGHSAAAAVTARFEAVQGEVGRGAGSRDARCGV
jgi:hypothetical protein